MKKSMNMSFKSSAPLLRRATAFSLAFALLAGSLLSLPARASAQQPATVKKTARLSEEQRILHVLNRLGFGARPNDVERVRKMGLERYIEEQLAPDQIEDAAAEAKLKNLSSYWMTTAELYQKYPQPGQLLRQLQRQGRLPADLAELRENGKGGNSPTAKKEDAGAKPGAEGAMAS